MHLSMPRNCIQIVRDCTVQYFSKLINYFSPANSHIIISKKMAKSVRYNLQGIYDRK